MRSSKLIINILVALAVSLVVNLSYIMALVLDINNQEPPRNMGERSPIEQRWEGIISIGEEDNFGFVIINRDTIYVPPARISQYSLRDGDTLRFTTTMSRRYNMAHPTLTRVARINGEHVERQIVAPIRTQIIFVLQTIYYFILSLSIISIITMRSSITSRRRYDWVVKLITALAVAIILYMLAPVTINRGAGITLNLLSKFKFDFMLLLRWCFATIVSALYSYLYILFVQRQSVLIENERLERENIKSKYTMLMNQVNPHFFFNTLNSLSMLVRERDQNRSLTYIEQLSYTFRYILQSGENRLTTLGEEMKFTDAYIYLFNIRYGEKLTFNIDIPDSYNNWQLPALSLQPLLDNAVKHNTITLSKPFAVNIKIEDDALVIANAKQPKLEKEPSTGIGLENLQRRWELLNGDGVEVVDGDQTFSVKLPLIKPNNEDSNS